MKMYRWCSVVFGAAMIAVAITFYYASSSKPIAESSQWIAVQYQSLESRIGLVGHLEAVEQLTIAAPFEGVLSSVLVSEGQRVVRGQPLLTLDTRYLDIQLRQALADQLKSRRVVQDMNRWSESQDVARARRTLVSAKLGLDDTERKLADAQSLFARGIVPRLEVDALVQQVKVQQLDVASAQLELGLVLDKGKGEYRQIADMELKNAQSRYDSLLTLKERQQVNAPFSGVLIRPSIQGLSSSSSGRPSIQVGARVTEGLALFELVGLESFRVIAHAQEADVVQLQEGQPVQVLGDGFEGEVLQGTVQSIGAKAESGESGAGTTYEVVVFLPPLTEQQQKTLRLGMSASLIIVTYHNDVGILVPMEAIQVSDGKNIVSFRNAMDEAPAQIPITLGRAMPNGVEVFDLRPGFIEKPFSRDGKM